MTNEERNELQTNLVQALVDGMDMKTVCAVAFDYLDNAYDSYSNEELITEVKEYHPELLDSDHDLELNA